MKIVFISNYLNHHQKPLSDELYRLTGGNYWFVATAPMQEERKKLGYKELEEPYLRKCYGETYPNDDIQQIILSADAVIIGSAPYTYISKRQKEEKCVFIYTERIYKQRPKLAHVFAHRLRNKFLYNRYKKTYLLCASAYTSTDFARIGCFKGRAYKWGYFTAVPEFDVDKKIILLKDVTKIKILWVARFLFWKHPEIPVKVASRLKENGVDFEINMYGIGPEMDKTRQLIEDLGVSDCVHLKGSVPNEKIIEQMRQHQIFLFTSDRNEGWGAVANEAMSNGCVIVASDSIGSIPYLVTDEENGMIYKDGNIDDLVLKLQKLIDHPDNREEMSRKAYRCMKDVWSPENAAKNLIRLIGRLSNGLDTDIIDGPCSKS